MFVLCVQHFEGFDPEGYSLWFCDYKYPEENTVNYIVMNKVTAVLKPLFSALFVILQVSSDSNFDNKPWLKVLAIHCAVFL